MTTMTPETAHKGSAIFVQTIGSTVEVWMSSPTGDSSDSHIIHIPCINLAQAEAVARLWKGVWGL
jgi:hypothetical protein